MTRAPPRFAGPWGGSSDTRTRTAAGARTRAPTMTRGGSAAATAPLRRRPGRCWRSKPRASDRLPWSAASGAREALLDWIDAELDRVYGGGTPEHPAMQTLQREARAHQLPGAPFRRLVEANRRDQAVARYETFDELLAYCELSAAPVGE